MSGFLFGACLLVAVCAALLLPALRARTAQPDARARQNIAAAKQRLRELGAHDDAHPARAEIELALLDDVAGGAQDSTPPKAAAKFASALLLALIPLSAAGLYLALGSPHALVSQVARTPSLDQLLAQLEQKLSANRDDAAGWQLAAQTYMRLGRYAEAARAYRELHRLRGDDADLLAAWSDAEVMAGGGKFTAQIRARLQRALELNPEQRSALWLSALAADSAGDTARALEILQQLMPLFADDEPTRALLTDFTARMQARHDGDADAQTKTTQNANAKNTGAQNVDAQTLDSENTAAQTSSAQNKNTQPASPRAVNVQVQLADSLAAQVRADDTVYVFAKSTDGGAPLAVSRHRAAELPLRIRLDDSHAMTPQLRLSDFARVTVRARISRSGNARAQPGDLESEEVVARTEHSGVVQLRIEKLAGGK